MSAIQLAPGVHWIGAIDKDIRVFDVIMKAEQGTTYNSYLVQGSKGCALIETVKARFYDSYLSTIETLVDPAQIDYIVMNHAEPDHSGSLGKILQEAQSAQLVASKNGVPFIQGILNQDVDVRAVGDDDSIDLGGVTLEFIQAPFLHWPDTMFTFVREHGILFPCDFLGSHYADERMFDDELDDFTYARSYYFDHIIRPFKEFAVKAMDKIEDLPVQIIAPSHGPVLRTDVNKYIEECRNWCAVPSKGEKPRVLVFYASSYGNTRRMAESVADGCRGAGADVTLFDLEVTVGGSILDEVESADALAVGSLTINGDAVKPVWDFLSSLATLKLRGKAGAAFGCFGWSGEAVKFIEDRMKAIKLKVPVEGVRAKLMVTEQDLDECRALGKSLTESLTS
ncbi:MAG: FprA family A-type flavoprotein [bacterium]|nr:FprA family A-type flavoprotein [bacterium]MDT8365476.1 FprA family A-type flavoprotein [bacterium]